MLQGARRQRQATLLLLGVGHLRAGQIVHGAAAQCNDAGDATVDHAVAALVSTAEFVGQLVGE